ncbi:MAG: UDP-N-acetylmuramoyl-tripeptide--D-alanyl-D-alanine ligase [Ruminococcus sp.]|jgi:UDP-N-acetylmuramoyl-tripeptide--D-alanyl-D-alanine ligase|nr:UDP-N-acetylmuramoyl-tripeptide--D-alanyl-D-alanine ligase [Ruminococcus sp.]
MSICTDTRKIKSGDTFYALKGENFDGHDYILQAFEKGAEYAVCEFIPDNVLNYDNVNSENKNSKKYEEKLSEKCKIVNNVLKELLKNSSEYRKCYNIPLIGITGSVGKTTTKEMVALVMSSKYKTLKTKANLNNEIGTAWTLLELGDEYTAAVLEMGMNHFGELKEISNAARPTCGVITNIGDSHIGNLGSREGILKAKLEILSGMEPCAPLVINNDDRYLSKLELNRPIVTVGIENKNSNYVAENIILGDGKTEFDIVYDKKRKHIVLPALGRHNVLNALIAFAIGKLYNISAADIATSLLNYKNVGDRQNIVRKNSYTLIVDCYNASYQSIKASIDVVNEVSGGRKLIVLGDVLELGDFSQEIHRRIGELIPVDALFFAYGENMKYATEGLKNDFIFHTTSMSELCAAVRDNIRKGDTVSVKGSNAMNLIELVNYLEKEPPACEVIT